MKTFYHYTGFKWPLILIMAAYCLTGCFPERVVTSDDYEALDVRRPGLEHHIPLSNATEVSRSDTIKIWFDELMDTASVRENFLIWPSIKIDSVQAIAIDPGNPEITYAATQRNGIFKSDDGTESWQWLTPASLRMPITDLWVSNTNSNTLYVSTADSGIYKSLDGGTTWQQVNTGLAELNVLALIVDPTNDDIVYAAMKTTGIYKSEDGGSSWTAKNSGVTLSREPRDIVISPLNSNTLYAPTGGDFILKSVDGGANWTRLTSGFLTKYFNTLAIHPLETALIFAGSDGGGLYKTEDGGSNWILISSGSANMVVESIVLHPQDTSTIVISKPDGIFKSLDKGRTWTTIQDVPAADKVSMLAIDPVTPERLLAATTAGVYQSVDLGETWIPRNTLPLVYLPGSIEFEEWQDSIVVITPQDYSDSTTLDTTVIFPYIYDRALERWIAEGSEGEPPAETDPRATKMTFKPSDLLPPMTRIQVRIRGTFESDRETMRDSFGARDINGNSFETDRNFTFTTAKD